MKQQALRTTLRGRSAAFAILVAAALGSAYAVPGAQTPAKKVLSVEDYTKWRTISGQEISGDGNWVTYGQALTNTVPTETKPVLHLVRLETNQHVEVPNAHRAASSRPTRSGSRTRSIRPAAAADAAAAARQRRSGDRARTWRHGGASRRAGRSAAREPGTADDAARTESADDPPTQPPATPPAPGAAACRTPPAPRPLRPRHRHRARQADAEPGRHPPAVADAGRAAQPRDRRSEVVAGHPVVHVLGELDAPDPAPQAARPPRAPPDGRGGAAADDARRGRRRGRRPATAAAPAGPRGTDVIVHNLVTGRDQLLGSVGDIAFNKSGELLAYTVDASVKDGNGLFVLDLKTNRMHTLDNDATAVQPADVERRRHGARGAEGARRREDARARQPADRVPQRPGRALRSSRPRRRRSIRPRRPAFPRAGSSAIARALDWSDDNKRVFFGAKAQVPAPDTARAQGHGRARERRRVEHRRRARPVAADDPRRAGSELHVPPGVRRRRRQVRQARRRDHARSRRRAGRPLGRRPRHARLHPRLQARRPPTSIASTPRPASGR